MRLLFLGFGTVGQGLAELLLAKRDIVRLASKVAEKGLSVIPLAIGLEGNWIKVEIALARGKKLHDKRETIKRREADREMRREVKERSR